MEKDVRDRADAAASKKNVLLIVPKLDQGGLEAFLGDLIGFLIR